MTETFPDTRQRHTRVLAVVGPTAVGKTDLAESLAVLLDGEIVSADSMQVYRGMDIGTAKPALALRRVRYHCIDLVDPGEPYSAALFQRDARTAIGDISRRGRLPVLCGGTGLYVRAALDDWSFPAGGQQENEARGRFEAYAEDHGPAALHALLAQRDEESAAAIHPNNVRRVVRALELLESGSSYAQETSGFSRRISVYDARMLGLTMQREELYRRIDARVDTMMEHGLLGEVRALVDAGLRDALTAGQAIGYKELLAVVEGRETLEAAVESIKRSSRRYAKRQLTWFRADPRIRWIDVTGMSSPDQTSAALDAIDWAKGR